MSISEAYLEGRLGIVALFKPRPGSEFYGRTAAACYECDPLNLGPALEANVLDMSFLLRGKQNDMLVSDVKDMEFDKVFSIPSRVRLYFIEDESNDLVAGTTGRFGLSFDGTFKVLPRAVFGEGEFGVFVDGAAIGFHENTVSVIQGGPEVMKRIAEDCGCMPGQGRADMSRFPRAIVGMAPDSLFVGSSVSSENVFELADVMFGPFGL